MTPVNLAIDVSSGDFGAAVLIEGVLQARSHCSSRVCMYLCGDSQQISAHLHNLGVELDQSLRIEHCSQTITAQDIPSRAWKNKTDAPLIRCITLQQQGVVDASVSAGDTGTLLAASLFILGRQEGVSRPALAAFIPTTCGYSLLLDVGANLECRSEHLLSFARLGAAYYARFSNCALPRIALLNIGKEPHKGTPAVMQTDATLRETCQNYLGYVEGSQVLAGIADVIVCDGFAGNVLLKACESFYSLTAAILGPESQLLHELKSKMTILNPENYGSVPLLGVNGIVMKAHGHSSARAMANAILNAVSMAQHKTAHPA